jgi:hypothetical protein
MKWTSAFLILFVSCSPAHKNKPELISDTTQKTIEDKVEMPKVESQANELGECLGHPTALGLVEIYNDHLKNSRHYNLELGVRGHFFNISQTELGITCVTESSWQEQGEFLELFVVSQGEMSRYEVPRHDFVVSKETNNFAVYQKIPTLIVYRGEQNSPKNLEAIKDYLHEWDHFYFKNFGSKEMHLRFLPKLRSQILAKSEIQNQKSLFVEKLWAYKTLLRQYLETHSKEFLPMIVGVLKSLETKNKMSWEYFQTKELSEGFSEFYAIEALYPSKLLRRREIIQSQKPVYFTTAALVSELLREAGLSPYLFYSESRLSVAFEKHFASGDLTVSEKAIEDLLEQLQFKSQSEIEMQRTYLLNSLQ